MAVGLGLAVIALGVALAEYQDTVEGQIGSVLVSVISLIIDGYLLVASLAGRPDPTGIVFAAFGWAFSLIGFGLTLAFVRGEIPKEAQLGYTLAQITVSGSGTALNTLAFLKPPTPANSVVRILALIGAFLGVAGISAGVYSLATL